MTESLQPAELAIGDERIECLIDLAASSLAARTTGPSETTLALVLDDARLPRPESVRSLSARLLRLASEGATVGVRAGAITVLRAACASVDVVFTSFTAGEPTRAEVAMTLAEAARPATLAERGTHVFMAGEDLPGVAYTVYGDAARWRAIAEASAIDDPLAVRPGTILNLPPAEH